MIVIGRTTSPVICRKHSILAVAEDLYPTASRDFEGNSEREELDAEIAINKGLTRRREMSVGANGRVSE